MSSLVLPGISSQPVSTLGRVGEVPATIPDLAGSNDGTNNGAKVAVVDGVPGLEFDGVDDYIDLPDRTLDALASEDFAFRIRGVPQVPDSFGCVIGNGFSATNVWVFYIRDSSARIEFSGDAGNRDDVVWFTTAIFNTPTEFVGRWTASDSTMRLYAALDGGELKLRASASYTDSGDFNTGDAEIGRRPGLDSRYTKGFWREPEFWSGVDTPSEQWFKDNSNKPITGNGTGLVAYYRGW